MTPEEVYEYFNKKGVYYYSYTDLSMPMRDSLVDIYNYMIEGKGDIPKLITKSYDDGSYMRRIMYFGLKYYIKRTVPMLFSIDEDPNNIIIDSITSDAMPKALPYIKPFEEKFLKQLKIIKNNRSKFVYFEMMEELVKVFPETYKADLLSFCKEYLLNFKYDNSYHSSEEYGGWKNPKYLSEGCIAILKEGLNKADYDQLFKTFPSEAPDVSWSSIKYIVKHFGKEAMPYLANTFKSQNINDSSEYTKTLTEILPNYDWSPYTKEIWAHSAKLRLQNQSVMAKLLATDEKEAIKCIKTYISGKGGKPTLAYFVLGNIQTDEAKKIFETNFHQEKNDKKVRQIVLPTAQNYFYKNPLTLDQVNAIIDKAHERGALEWKEGMIEEMLPDLYLKNGDKMTQKQVRFLFYRMSFITEMKSEPEAKLLLNFIDGEKSNEFAAHILKVYLDRGSIAKEKYVMCLAGLLGNDELLADLQKLFKDVYEAKRMKMTQYVIGTMALIGSDKALRFIEYVSRKFKSKAALSSAAVEALEIAADELGIDIYELSDRILPDFGFDGLYKTIQVGVEEMRVFVANDFKLQYITEDNKIRKSLPKAASKELKAELKVTQKEIREVNRAQKEKLEQYMVLERRWSYEDWQKFYLMNPVMFIYASTLVWGVFDKDNKVKTIFYLDEDASILDFEDDDLDIDDDSLRIGMIHNLRITEEQKKDWIDKFYELEITQPFEQLLRKSFVMDAADKDKEGIDKYEGMKAAKGGRAVQGYFEKRGWRKEVSDGGCFDLSKKFDKENMYAFLNLQGLCIGWYEEDVEFYSITFHKTEDYHWDSKKIKMKDVPPIIFSEVTADMEGIIKREEEETE